MAREMVWRIFRRARPAFLTAAVFALSSCGGGGAAGAPATVGATPTPVPTASPPAVSSSAGTVSASGPTTVFLPPAAGGVGGSIDLTTASTTATIALTLSAASPAGAPSLQSNRRLTQTIGAAVTGLAYLTAQSSADVTFTSTFGANISVPGPVNGTEYLVMFDPTNPNAGWSVVSGPGTAAAGIARGLGSIVLSFTKGATYDLALIATNATLTLPSPTPSPTPTPAPVVVNIPSLQFLGVGATFAKTITVTQASYNGQFTLSGGSCNGIAATNATTSLQSFTITPLTVGTCSYTLTGGGGAQTALPVTVTTLTVGGQ